MGKVRFTADTLLSIIKQVFDDEDIDEVVESEYEEWNNKKLSEILNIDYYSYKHKAPSTATLQEKIAAQNPDRTLNVLDVLTRGFCLVSMVGIDRLYSKDIDQIVVDGSLEFWVQSQKAKLVEALIENANIALCGLKLPIEINGEQRKVSLFFKLSSASMEGQTEIGESAIINVDVTLEMSPATINYGDWQVALEMDKEGGGEKEFVNIPITGIQINSTMTGKAMPKTNDPSHTKTNNLSNSVILTINFDAYSGCKATEQIIADTLGKGTANVKDKADNNKIYPIKLVRFGQEFVYNMKIQEHQIIIKNDTNPETHVVSFTTGE